MNTDLSVATEKNDTVYHPGYYLIEMWGGKGGNQVRADRNSAGYGGSSGNIYGIVYLEYGSAIYFTLGGNGEDGASVSADGGSNGGGGAYGIYPGAGGGYSAFAVGATTIDQAGIDAGNVLIIAGGGGGGGSNSTTIASRKPGAGGGGLGSSARNGSGGGGGGSSFVANSVTFNNLAQNVTSMLVGTNPSSTGGAVVITYLGKTL